MTVKKAVIPAAGFGTRMLPATKSIPKEMLPLVDKPSIHYIVEEAVASGIEDILIITSRGKEAVGDYFDYAPELEAKLIASGRAADAQALRAIADMAKITFVRQKEQKGLGHAVALAKSFAGEDPVAVLLGDDVMQGIPPVTRQLIDVYEESGCPVVGVAEVPASEIHRYCSLGVTKCSERLMEVHRLVEKPKPEEVLSNYAILGRYVLPPDIFPILEGLSAGYGGEIQLTDALDLLCRQTKLLALAYRGVRYDTGNLRGYLEAQVKLALQHPEVGEWFKDFIKTV